eukprot:12424479-Karenia_brevis.AAC.2
MAADTYIAATIDTYINLFLLSDTSTPAAPKTSATSQDGNDQQSRPPISFNSHPNSHNIPT